MGRMYVTSVMFLYLFAVKVENAIECTKYNFQHLCVFLCWLKPLGAVDYLEIARCFDTVFIRNVPQLRVGMKDQARRFITLIDNFYDQKVTHHITSLYKTLNIKVTSSVSYLVKT